jgi:23S rRNA pseudouridine1911/1915/1917 synthase
MQISELIIAQNHQFIVANKPSGTPIQPDKTGDKSLLELLEIYSKSKLFVVHRLDRPVSGVVVFARNKNAAANLSRQFHDKRIEKNYIAVVGKLPEPANGMLTHFLKKKGNEVVIVPEEAEDTDLSELSYELLISTERYHFLKIELKTGRFHQIRAQLAAIGSPIKGDVKYGFRRSNTDRSIHLHAWRLGFRHPVTKEDLMFEVPFPDEVLWNYLKENSELFKTENTN